MLAMRVRELESRVKIAHITDVHVQAPPRLSEMTGKRLLGTANLYLLGRKSKEPQSTQGKVRLWLHKRLPSRQW